MLNNGYQRELEQGAHQAAQDAAQVALASLIQVLKRASESERRPAWRGKAWHGAQGAPSSVLPIEIEVDGEVLWQEDMENTRFRKDVGLDLVEYLETALELSPGERVAEDDESFVCISLGGRQVLCIEDGVVTQNELQQVAQRHHYPESLVMNQLNGRNGNGASKSSPGAQDPVASPPAPLSAQFQRLSDQQSHLLERLDNANKLAASNKPAKWMKQSFKARMWAAAGEKLALPRAFRRREVAAVALELLEKFGDQGRRGYVYESEGYVFKGKDTTVTVQDREGRDLVFIRTRAIGPPKVYGYYLTPDQEQDFLKVRQRLRKDGWKSVSNDPLIRSKQLGKLTPAGDLLLTEDFKALAVAEVARSLLDVGGTAADRSGKRVLDGRQYRIEETPQGLKIETRNRGEILSTRNGKLTSNLTDQDLRHFIFVAKEVGREMKQIKSAFYGIQAQVQR